MDQLGDFSEKSLANFFKSQIIKHNARKSVRILFTEDALCLVISRIKRMFTDAIDFKEDHKKVFITDLQFNERGLYGTSK